MKIKIIAGVIIGIAIIVGIGFVFTNSENNLSNDTNLVIDEVIEQPSNNEGKQFTVELSDTVHATGP